MHNKRTKVLVADSVEKWQQRLHQVRAYEVDLIIVTNGRVHLDDCPTAIENGLSRCCSRKREEEYTFWRSFPFENGTQRLKPVALWSQSLNLFRMSSIDLEMITLRIAVLPYDPYMIVKSKGGEVTLENCVFKEIISFISERLNFRYKLVTPPDEEWGSKLNNNQWSGAIGMIIRGEADMIPYLTMTPSRQEAVDFSKPLAYVTYKILIPFPREPPRAFIFLRPYTKEVWFSLMFAALLVSYALWKIHTWSSHFDASSKRAKSLMSFSNCFWIIYGATLQQGGTSLPVTNSARLVLSSWWLGVMVIMATYSANLIAFLAFPEMKWVLKKLEDLANHKTLHLSIKSSCPVLEDFKESNITLYKKIREVYLSNLRRSHQIQDKHHPIPDMVAEGKTVFIDDVNFLNRLINEDFLEKGKCRITLANEEFSRMDLALGMRRGSSMIALVNEEIQQMREHGVLRFWKNKYSPSKGECFEVQTTIKGRAKVSLQDLQGPFYLLALGSTIGLTLLSVEFCLRVLKARHSRCLKRKPYRKKMALSLW
ncbi:ionotropic receptor 93a-like [Uloborus diversus]|uniref:ionotropic receptor 93a-like n=1 Tax=Uloborus diversus TaxID=327109 RepID=UPI0024098852|nr:ionotropic receptor 93a-like [Uloborus diversus]